MRDPSSSTTAADLKALQEQLEALKAQGSSRGNERPRVSAFLSTFRRSCGLAFALAVSEATGEAGAARTASRGRCAQSTASQACVLSSTRRCGTP